MLSNTSERFTAYAGEKIAIYGLSIQTEELLKSLDRRYCIVGLLDGCKESGMLYNKPIMSITAALQGGVKLIIVAARPESCKIIAKRIGNLCKENQTALLDIRGNDLLLPTKKIDGLSGLGGMTREQILAAVEQHDAVSFDLFDTLLARQTLFPTDVFEIVDFRLRQKGIFIEDFHKKRLESEKELCRQTVPTLTEIYAYMKTKYAVSDLQPNEAAEMEWEVDDDLLILRNDLACVFAEICHRGKPVYIVTDTFYTKKQVIKFLNKRGVTQWTDILTSCEYRTSKTQHLFDRLKEMLPGKRCVHIGDSAEADIQGAEKADLSACRISSVLDMFEQVGYLDLWDEIDDLPSRVQVGIFAAKLFNSPFRFQQSPVCVKSPHDIGFLLFAPIISGFVFWFHHQVQMHGLKNIWFSARDGYLIKKLYDELIGSDTSVYFLTSRTAAIRAGMETGEDIRYVEEMRFSGSVEEQLRSRFGLSATHEMRGDSLNAYAEEIFEKAAVARENYQNYIKKVTLGSGSIAFFDFVARGTTQMYVGRLVPNHLKGFYFLRQDEGYMGEKGLDITAFYKQDDGEANLISENYYILETILTAPSPTVVEFDEQGNPCYAEETRSPEEMRCIQMVQQGIIDYFHVYRKICPAWKSDKNKELNGMLLALIHRIISPDSEFRQLNVEDPFFRRTSKVSDLI